MSATARPISRPSLAHKMLANTSWLVGDRMSRMALALVLYAFIARHLGVESLGALNLGGAITAIAMSLANLGLDSVLVKDLAQHPTKAGSIIGSALLLRGVTGALAFVVLLVSAPWLAPAPASRAVSFILSFGLLLQALDLPKLVFESRIESRIPVVTQYAGFVVGSVLKIVLIACGAGVKAFAFAQILETSLHIILSWTIFIRRHPDLVNFRPSLERALGMARSGLPLVLNGFLIGLYMKLDIIIVGKLLGDREVGIYTASTRLIEVWFFLPGAVMASLFPAIASAHRENKEIFDRRVRDLLHFLIYLALGLAVGAMVFADLIIKILYGSRFAGAESVLRVYCWAAIPVFFGTGWSGVLVVLGKQKFTPVFHGIGLLCNAALNLLLVPRMGYIGAAVATVVSYALSQTAGILGIERAYFGRILLDAFRPSRVMELSRQLFHLFLSVANRIIGRTAVT